MKKTIRPLAILAAVLAVCSMGTGCTSNGGPWYKPSTYTYHNPFSKDKGKTPHDKHAGMVAGGQETDKSVLDNSRPSINSSPNIKGPLGGYSNEAPAYQSSTQQARVTPLSGNYSTPDQSMPQTGIQQTAAVQNGYGQAGAGTYGMTQNPSVAMATPPVTGGYSPAEGVYSAPVQSASYQMGTPSQGYGQQYPQGTFEQQQAVPQVNPGTAFPGTGYTPQATPATVPMTAAPTTAAPAVQPGPVSPFAATPSAVPTAGATADPYQYRNTTAAPYGY